MFLIFFLQAMTEGRLGAITHEVVPDYLRTKPQPEVEEKVCFVIVLRYQ